MHGMVYQCVTGDTLQRGLALCVCVFFNDLSQCIHANKCHAVGSISRADSIRYPSGIRARLAIKHSTRSAF